MEDLLDKFSSSAPPSASSGGPAYSQLVDEVADLKATGPPHHPPADEKYISLFPESLDRTLAPLDDAIMSVVQSAARGPMGSTVVMLAKIGTVCTAIEVRLAYTRNTRQTRNRLIETPRTEPNPMLTVHKSPRGQGWTDRPRDALHAKVLPGRALVAALA